MHSASFQPCHNTLCIFPTTSQCTQYLSNRITMHLDLKNIFPIVSQCTLHLFNHIAMHSVSFQPHHNALNIFPIVSQCTLHLLDDDTKRSLSFRSCHTEKLKIFHHMPMNVFSKATFVNACSAKTQPVVY